MTNKKKHSQEAPDIQEETIPPEIEIEVTEEDTPEDAAEALRQAQDKCEEYLNMAQRVQADFENFKRRNQNVRADAFAEGKQTVITDLLPVLDNLERALVAAEGDESPLKSGLELVDRQLMEVLAKLGVTEIDCHGKPFDPEEANAVMQTPRDDMEPGTVCDVMQKGYRMGDKVLRYAMVQVASEG